MATFSPERFASLLRTTMIGKHLTYTPSIPSTQDAAKAFLEHRARSRIAGNIFLAEVQTSGRGRKSRTFVSTAAGNLYFTIIWNEKSAEYRFMPLKLVRAIPVSLSLAIERATRDIVRPMIKWPNDLWVDSLKVSGMLIDTESDGDYLRIMAGVGVNVAVDPSDEDISLQGITTSIAKQMQPANRAHLQPEIDREALLADFCNTLETLLLAEEDGSDQGLAEAYRTRSVVLGKRVHVLPADASERPYEAYASAVDEWGFLKVVLDDGSTRMLSAEEVSLRPSWSS